MLRVWMEKESSLGVLGLQKSKSTELSPPPTPNPEKVPKVAETTRAGTRRTPTTRAPLSGVWGVGAKRCLGYGFGF